MQKQLNATVVVIIFNANKTFLLSTLHDELENERMTNVCFEKDLFFFSF